MKGRWALNLMLLFGPDPEVNSGIVEGVCVLSCEGF